MFRPWSILTFLCAAGFFQRSMAPPVKTSIRDSVIYFWIFIGSIYWLTTGAVSAQIALTWQSVLKKTVQVGLTCDLSKPPCVEGFWDIFLLSFLFFLNANRSGAFVYFRRNKHKQARRICFEAQWKKKSTDTILQAHIDFFFSRFFSFSFFFPAALSVPVVFDCETFNRGTSSFISVTKSNNARWFTPPSN